MTRIFVPRGGPGGSSSSSSRTPPTSSSSAAATPICREDQEQLEKEPQLQELGHSSDDFLEPLQDVLPEGSVVDEGMFRQKPLKDESTDNVSVVEEFVDLQFVDNHESSSSVLPHSGAGSAHLDAVVSHPPPPPIPPPKPTSPNANSKRNVSGNPTVRIGPPRRQPAWPQVVTWSSPSGSRPSSPRSVNDGDGYNSADEQVPGYTSSFDDSERERMFEIDLRCAKGYEIRKMLEDGNCLFRAVADQVYGDPEAYDLARQLCVDYMERERDHFSQFITESFTTYCKRKRRDKVYGNNVEIQAFAEMYNRPIHIYSYSTEPINIFQGSYNTDIPPIRLSYHHGNHYNSVIDPRRLTVGAGLGFSSLRGVNIDKDQVKAAIKAQQDQQIDNALLAEGRYFSDLELTEKEIERMVMEASRAEYLAGERSKQQHLSIRDSSTSGAEPSSSAARSSRSVADRSAESLTMLPEVALTGSMQLLLAMGFTYMQVMEAYSIFGDDVESMICYLLETGGGGGGSGMLPGSSNRQKGKATE